MRAAVRGHAAWCQRVCAAQGVRGRRVGDRWFAATRAPDGYPDAISLRPAVEASDLLDGPELGPGCSVTDSWSDVELGPHGFAVHTTGAWLWAPPAEAEPTRWRTVGPDELDTWNRLHSGGAIPPHLLIDPGVHLLLRGASTEADACAVVTSAVPGVASVSNLVAPDVAAAWAELTAWCGDQLPGRAVVGQEAGARLEAAASAGLAVTGQLRVWCRSTP